MRNRDQGEDSPGSARDFCAGMVTTAIAITGPCTADRATGETFEDRVRGASIPHGGVPVRGPYHFVASTSWSITLSRHMAATNRFSLACPSSNRANWRACPDSSPAYPPLPSIEGLLGKSEMADAIRDRAPIPAGLSMATICPTLKRGRFTASSFPRQRPIMPETLPQIGTTRAGSITYRASAYSQTRIQVFHHRGIEECHEVSSHFGIKRCLRPYAAARLQLGCRLPTNWSSSRFRELHSSRCDRQR